MGTSDTVQSIDSLKYLQDSLKPLKTINETLPERAFSYISIGDDIKVLLDLQAHQGSAGEMLGKPGRWKWGHHSNQKGAEASLNARNQFYLAQDAHTLPAELLVRLGKIFEAADQGKSLEKTGAQVPDWLLYLFSDAIHCTFKISSGDTLKRKARRGWNAALARKLLETEEGQAPSAAFLLVFEAKELGEYYSDRLDLLNTGKDMTDYLLAHHDEVTRLYPQLSAISRILFVKRLGDGTPELSHTYANAIIRLAADTGKTVRAEASKYLHAIDIDRRLAVLGDMLQSKDSAERERAADLLGHTQEERSQELLLAAQTTETSKTVKQTIDKALMRLAAADSADAQDLPEAPPYTAFTSTTLDDEVLQLLKNNHQELLAELKKHSEQEIEENKDPQKKYKSNWRQRNYKDYSSLSEEGIKQAFALLNKEPTAQADKNPPNNKGKQRQLGQSQLLTLGYKNRLSSLPQFTVVHLLRWLMAADNTDYFWHDSTFQSWLHKQDASSIDLRMLADTFQQASYSIQPIAHACLRGYWGGDASPLDILPAECIWPFFAEHPEYIDEGLGLVPSKQTTYQQYEMGKTIAVLATFPSLPGRWIPRLLELALGEGKTHRAIAQEALKSLPNLNQQIIEALASSKQEIRTVAANWLAERDCKNAVPVLYKTLEKETRETTRAAILNALEKLGEDINPLLAPDKLLAEAEKGLKKIPSSLNWFPFSTLPRCQWQTGGIVEPKLIQWWVVLACKLKEPAGNALLTRYLKLLDKNSQTELGRFILHQFIAQDTRNPSMEDALAYAQNNLAQHWQWHLNHLEWIKKHPEYSLNETEKTKDTILETLKRAKLAEYLGSAISEKGMLALIIGIPGHEIVTLLRAYMRDHYTRRSQIEAMLAAAAGSPDPTVIQLILAVSRRHRTASVQALARTLVESIAERNGWSQDQLADRTIPTAGFDETCKLELSYGERIFTVTLDAAMKPVLHNPDGKVLKALPEARQNEDAAWVKEAKSTFSGSKKELKQVIELQTSRLYEAMCAGRLWPVSEWKEYLAAHPIVSRLIQQLVWRIVDIDGTTTHLFRPTEDGSLIDAEDEEVSLSDDIQIGLTHAALMEASDVKAWQKHFKDYKVKPLFAQLNRSLPEKLALNEEEIDERKGWVSDTFTLRGTLTKMGYQRAAAEDGGFFDHYYKEFSSLGLRVQIGFSGNCLPEENVAAALTTLSFAKTTGRYNQRNVCLGDVPPILLAETYADYLAAAEACTGFDPEWEKKMPW